MADMREFESDIASDGTRGDILLAISNAIVRLYKECFGKGPTKAKTYHNGDVITCVLQGGMTKAEQTLLSSGHRDAVHKQRHMLQEAVRERFVASVEELTGRRVIGFMSGTQSDPEMSCEVFVLAPEGSVDGQSQDGSR